MLGRVHSIMPPTIHNDPGLLDALTAVASHAGQAILAAAPIHRLKADRSPVTAADEAAEAVILEGLARILPGVPVVSEEAVSRGEIPALASTFVLVDPLDGTREFLAGLSEYTVNIAVVMDETPVIGVIAAPALGLVWRGVAGEGSQRLRLGPGAAPADAAERIAIHPRRARSSALVATVSRSHPDPETDAFIGRLPGATRGHLRLIDEVLLPRRRDRRRLSAIGPADGVGYRRGTRHSRRRRRRRASA